MFYEEDLELHFWNGEKYDKSKILKFLYYILNTQKDVIEYQITVIEFDINTDEITDDLYEKNRIKKVFKPLDFKNNYELKELIENYFVEIINFKHSNNIEKNYYTFYSNGSIYYSYYFKVEDLNIKEIFLNIKDIYLDLINIFKPKVSNCGFESLWEDINRIQKEKSFEGLYGYLSNEYKIDFLKIKEKIDLKDGYLFIKDF